MDHLTGAPLLCHHLPTVSKEVRNDDDQSKMVLYLQRSTPGTQ
ncbi:hypothetical protein AOP6_2178 [Desulfuromonas sp. AOP6]|nr:hypothetical protein AOP6_2178 [Desulfuromonas sp. AOP6]